MKKTVKKSVAKAQLGSIIKGASAVARGASKVGKKVAKEFKPASYNPYRKPTPVKDIAKGLGVLGAYGTGAYMYLENDKKSAENKKKVAANKAKVEANAAKYKKAYGGSAKPLEKAQLGKIVKMASTALKGSSKFPEQKTLTKAAAELNVKNKKNLKNVQKNYNKPVPKFPEPKYVTKEQVVKNMAKRKSKNK